MSGSQNEKLTKSEEDLAFCIKQPRYNRIAAHLYLFEPFSKKNTCQGTVLCQSIFSLPSAFCTSMHFESSPKHHSLEDWHGYCISLRNKLLTCKCHIFNFQSIGVISHDRNWDFCWAPTPNPKKNNRSDWVVLTIKSATEVFTWICWGKKQLMCKIALTTKVHGLKPLKFHINPKKCRKYENVGLNYIHHQSLMRPRYRRTLTYHDLGQHVGHVHVLVKSVCHLY